MKTIYKFLFILILIPGLFNLFSQDKVRIRVKTPPLNQLTMKHIYACDLENLTNDNLKIRLEGFMSESKDGEIVRGKTGSISLGPKEKKSFNADNVPGGGEYSWQNNKYKEIIIRTGKAPSGSYTICVFAIDEGGNVVGQENCVETEVKDEGSITLISPEDGGEITREQPIIFSWTPLPGAKDYTLRIVEIKGDQSPEVAMKTNKPVWEKSGIATTTIQVPYIAIDEPGLKIMDKKKKWGWQVISGEVESEVWGFSVSSSCFTLEIVDSMSCNPNKANEFDVKIIFHNNSSTLTNCIMTVNSVTITGFTFSPPISTPFTLLPGTTQTYIGTLTGTASGSTIITNATSSAGLTQNMPNPFSVPKCNCCKDVIKQISQQLNSDGTKLTTDFKVGPNKIKQVRMNLVFVNSVTDKNCPVCKNRPAFWGNNNWWGDWVWDPGTSGPTFGNPADIHHRELTWTDNSGIDMFNTPRRLELGLLLDEILISSGVLKKCCKTEINYCIRYSFTDTACVTCDTVLCSKFVYGGNDLPRNDTTRTKYKDVEKLMQMNMQNKEYQKDGEGQGESKNEMNNYKILPPTQIGLPIWPIIRGPLDNNTSMNSTAMIIDMTSIPLHLSQEISTAQSNMPGCAQAGFDTCQLVFYVLHTGNGFSDNGLSIFRSDGIQLLGPGTSIQGLNGKKSDNEIQVVKHPDAINHPKEWFIIYVKNSSSQGVYPSPAYVPTNVLYSRIHIPDFSGTTINVLERDIELTFSGTAYTYVHGKAVTRPKTIGSEFGNILYLCRRQANIDNIYIDRFMITGSGIQEISSYGPINNVNWWYMTIPGSSIELSPTEDRLAVTSRDDVDDQEKLILFDVSTSISLISSFFLKDLVLDAIGNTGSTGLTGDGQTLDNVGSTIGSLSFLRNFERKISGIEFSPNGNFLYVTSGGYVQSSYANITYLGQIDLNSFPYKIRLQVETTDPTNDYNLTLTSLAGRRNVQWSSTTDGIYLAYHGITSIQSSYDGNLYFTKTNSETIFVIPNPDNPLPVNLDPHSVDLSTSSNPNITLAGGYTLFFPDQIDGFDYLTTNTLCTSARNCCDKFTTKVNSYIFDPLTKDKIRVRFEAGPNRIKRVMADIIDFTITHNDETSMGTNCSPCVPNSDQWGNFKNTPTSITGLGTGKLTVPSGSGTGFSREIVWGSLNGPGINMTGGTSWLTLPLSLPQKHSSSCCIDTVKFCVRYKFMDTTCVECDTAICYRIIRKGNIIINFKEEKLEKNEGMNIDENNDKYILNGQFTHSGQSAGIINLDLQNKSEVKITVYDADGKEKMKVYNDYMNSGQYSFDLNNYNLPDGVYFYRIEAEGITKYEKVLITKPSNGCNCGKK